MFCEVKLLLEGFCEQENSECGQSCIALSLQDTVTVRPAASKSVCGTNAMGSGKYICGSSECHPRVPRAPALCLQHSRIVIQQNRAISCHPCFWWACGRQNHTVEVGWRQALKIQQKMVVLSRHWPVMSAGIQGRAAWEKCCWVNVG